VFPNRICLFWLYFFFEKSPIDLGATRLIETRGSFVSSVMNDIDMKCGKKKDKIPLFFTPRYVSILDDGLGLVYFSFPVLIIIPGH